MVEGGNGGRVQEVNRMVGWLVGLRCSYWIGNRGVHREYPYIVQIFFAAIWRYLEQRLA